MNIPVSVKSNISSRVVEGLFTPKQLLAMYEDELVSELTECDCQPTGETNVIECNCEDEWTDYTISFEGSDED